MGLLDIYLDPQCGNPNNLGTLIPATTKHHSDAMKRAKKAKVIKILGSFSRARPAMSSCDIDDRDSILAFIALENLECANNDECQDCESVSIVQVEELCRIVKGDIRQGEYVHVTVHPNYMKAIHELKKTAYDLLPYFELYIRNKPQDTGMANSSLAEFKKQFQNAQKSGS